MLEQKTVSQGRAANVKDIFFSGPRLLTMHFWREREGARAFSPFVAFSDDVKDKRSKDSRP